MKFIHIYISALLVLFGAMTAVQAEDGSQAHEHFAVLGFQSRHEGEVGSLEDLRDLVVPIVGRDGEVEDWVFVNHLSLGAVDGHLAIVTLEGFRWDGTMYHYAGAGKTISGLEKLNVQVSSPSSLRSDQIVDLRGISLSVSPTGLLLVDTVTAHAVPSALTPLNPERTAGIILGVSAGCNCGVGCGNCSCTLLVCAEGSCFLPVILLGVTGVDTAAAAVCVPALSRVGLATLGLVLVGAALRHMGASHV